MNTTKLKILLQGPAVKESRIKVNDFILLIENLQKSVVTIAESLVGIQFGREGRPKKKVYESCQFELVRLYPGSLGIELELVQSTPQTSFFPNIGEKSLTIFLEEFGQLERMENIPEHFSEPVLNYMAEIGKIFKTGVEKISFSGELRDKNIEAIYSLNVYNNIIEKTKKTVEKEEATIVGILWEADWKDHTAELYDHFGNKIILRFNENFDDIIKTAGKKRVTAFGVAKKEEQIIKELTLEKLQIMEDVGAFKVSDVVSISDPLSLKHQRDPLANAKPLKDFSIFDDAPDDWNVDEFLEEIYRMREEDSD